MARKTLAHISDLHLGRSRETTDRAAALCRTLVDADIDHVVVTGDVTNGGRREELALFARVFAPLMAAGRLTPDSEIGISENAWRKGGAPSGG